MAAAEPTNYAAPNVLSGGGSRARRVKTDQPASVLGRPSSPRRRSSRLKSQPGRLVFIAKCNTLKCIAAC